MHRVLSTSQVGTSTIVLLIIVLIACNIRADGKVTSRKPPFNGSIFGKRSNLPPVQPATTPGIPMSQDIFDEKNSIKPSYSKASKRNNYLSDMLMQRHLQQEYQLQQQYLQQQGVALRVAIDRCLAQNDFLTKLEAIDFCEEKLALDYGYQMVPDAIEGFGGN